MTMTGHSSPSSFPQGQGPSASRGPDVLPADLLLRLHDVMVEARCLEERLIRMQRGGDGYFWIGGPGEEAFNAALGLLVNKGQGLEHDFLHLHYRSSATLLAMGADPIDALRQMKSVATDPYSGGRNFVGHYASRAWNVVPISSPIEVQYPMALGSAIAQKRHGAEFAGKGGITIVQGGDAGSAEGDFATCLVWASRPAMELPMLIIVTNNGWGISTAGHEQHGEQHVSDRGKAFGIKTMVIDGNDVEACYRGLDQAMQYVRNERKPLVLEAFVSRLYGHSSSSGSNFVENEVDCIAELENKLISRGLRSESDCKALRERIEKRLLDASRMVSAEPAPQAETIWDHVFADEDVVGQSAIKAPHDNKKWRLPAGSFPTQKPLAASKKAGN